MCELRQFERRVYSQHGEDGIIAEILRRTGIWGLAVELGSHHLFGNCYLLAEQEWPVLFVDRDFDHLQKLMRKINGASVSYKLVHVSVDNANLVIPTDTVFLSIDIDGNDYWIWRALKCRPAVVVIEFNVYHAPPSCRAIEYEPDFAWDGTSYFGASLSAMERLGKSKGYVLVATDTEQSNAYFVRRDFADRFEAVTVGELWYVPTWTPLESRRPMIELFET